MLPSSTSAATDTVKAVMQGCGAVLMFAFLAIDQSPLLAHIYDWLQLCKRSLLTLF